MKKKFSTLHFYLTLLRGFTPHYMFVQSARSLLNILEMLWYVFVPSLILNMLGQSYEMNRLLIRVLLLLFLCFVIRVGNRILTKEAAVLEEKFRNALDHEINVRMMAVNYEQIEDPTFVQKKVDALFPIETQSVIQRLFTSIPTLFQSIFLMASVISVILWLDPLIVVVVAVLTILGFLLSRKLIAIEVENSKTSARDNSQYNYYLRTIRNASIAKDVRIYQMQPFLVQRLRQMFDNIVVSSKQLYDGRNLRGLISQMLSVVLLTFTYGYLLFRTMNQGFDPSLFVLIVNSAVHFSDQLNVFLTEILVLDQQLIYLEPLQELFALFDESEPTGTILLEQPIQTVQFEDVYFRYPNTKEDVLKGLTLTLDDSDSLSIVGLNGSGKTTLIKLLSRLYVPQKGRILVNGMDIQELELSSYLKQLSIIFQDFKTFHYSLRENIKFDQPCDDEALAFAIEQSELGIELNKLKHGIDTKLSNDFDPDGINLSKGQEQKLVIARSIYADGSLMILDEPTASLDPLAEEEVYRHFRTIAKNKLTIFISHRLSSCRFSDKIIFLEDGVVKEAGCHEALIAMDGKYAQLFRLQAEKYQNA